MGRRKASVLVLSPWRQRLATKPAAQRYADFVTTFSPEERARLVSREFLNGSKLEEIYWLVREGGFTTVRRAAESELLRRLVDAGDLPGGLWKPTRFRKGFSSS